MALLILGLARMKRRTDRIFYYLCATISEFPLLLNYAFRIPNHGNKIDVMMCISYYTMGSNLGMTPVSVEFNRGTPRVRGDFREIFWVRYVQWLVSTSCSHENGLELIKVSCNRFINTPLILSIMLLPASLPAPKFLFTIFLNQTMIIMGLVGAVTSTTYKWGLFHPSSSQSIPISLTTPQDSSPSAAQPSSTSSSPSSSPPGNTPVATENPSQEST